MVSAMLRNVGGGPDPNAANADGFAATFHPGTINPNDAATVTVSLGEETSIEFAMSSARLARVSGTVVDSRGRPASGSFVLVVNRQGNGMFSVGGNQVAPDGTFTLNGIAQNYYPTVQNPSQSAKFDVMWAGWGADWPSGSTVIPPLFDSRPNLSADSTGQDYGSFKDDAINKQMDAALTIPDATAGPRRCSPIRSMPPARC